MLLFTPTYSVDIVWGSTYATYLKFFSVLQNQAVLLHEGGAYRHHVTLFYSALKTFKLYDLFKHEVAKTVFCHFQNNLPPLISHSSTKASEISSKNIRSSNDPNTIRYISRYRIAKLQRCIKYQGVKIWKNIPTEIKNKSFNHFKRNHKKLFIEPILVCLFFLQSLSYMLPYSMSIEYYTLLIF